MSQNIAEKKVTIVDEVDKVTHAENPKAPTQVETQTTESSYVQEDTAMPNKEKSIASYTDVARIIEQSDLDILTDLHEQQSANLQSRRMETDKLELQMTGLREKRVEIEGPSNDLDPSHEERMTKEVAGRAVIAYAMQMADDLIAEPNLLRDVTE